MEDVVNVFLCRDVIDIKASMVEYADSQRYFTDDVKINRHKKTVTVNGKWVTKFISNSAFLDGMCIREITISTRFSTGGDLDQLKHILFIARQGRVAFDNYVIRKAQG